MAYVSRSYPDLPYCPPPSTLHTPGIQAALLAQLAACGDTRHCGKFPYSDGRRQTECGRGVKRQTECGRGVKRQTLILGRGYDTYTQQTCVSAECVIICTMHMYFVMMYMRMHICHAYPFTCTCLVLIVLHVYV